MKTRMMIYMAALLAFMAAGAGVAFSHHGGTIPATGVGPIVAYNYSDDGKVNAIQTATDLLSFPEVCGGPGSITTLTSYTGTTSAVADTDSSLRPVSVTSAVPALVPDKSTSVLTTVTLAATPTAFNYDADGEKNGFYIGPLLVLTGTEPLELTPPVAGIVVIYNQTTSCSGVVATVVKATSYNGVTIHGDH